MKKKTIILSVLLCILFLSEAHAATYSTSATGSSQGYKVTATANWQYETGKYASKGSHTINSSPKDTILTKNYLNYVLTAVDTDYKVTQYFRPKYVDVLSKEITFGDSFPIVLRSAGPR